MNAQVVVREYRHDDRNFVLSSWLQTQYFSSPYWSQMPQDLFYTTYAERITSLLANKEVKIDSAVTTIDGLETIIGYIVYSGNTLYWAYVKKDYRSAGVFNMLLRQHTIANTASTTLAGASIAKKKKIVFNPFLWSNNGINV